MPIVLASARFFLEALLFGSTYDLDVQVLYFLSQGISIKAQQLSGLDAIAIGRRQAGGDQRRFHLAQDTVI